MTLQNTQANLELPFQKIELIKENLNQVLRPRTSDCSYYS